MRNHYHEENDNQDSNWSHTDSDTLGLSYEEFEYLSQEKECERMLMPNENQTENEYQIGYQNEDVYEHQTRKEDFDAVSRNLSHLPPICMIDSDHFDCDDFNALDYLVMDIANERFGVKDYSSDGTKPTPLQTTQSTSTKSTHPRIRLVRCIRTIRKQGLKLAVHHGASKCNSGIHVPKDCNEIAHMLINLRQLSSEAGMGCQQMRANSVLKLYKLTRNPDKASELAHYCGIPLLLQTMEQSMKNLALHRYAVGILLNISLSSVDYILSQIKVFHVLVAVMKEHSSCIPLVHTILLLLQELLTLNQQVALDTMTEANADLTIMSIIKSSGKKTQHLPIALANLSLFCNHREESRIALTTSDNIMFLVKLVKDHDRNLPVHQEAFKLLQTLNNDDMPVPRALLKDLASVVIIRKASMVEKNKNRHRQIFANECLE